MRKISLVSLALTMLFLLALSSGCKKSEIRVVLKKMMHSTVVLPDNITCIRDGDSYPLREYMRGKGKLIVFVDSTECSLCRIDKFVRYEDLIEQAEYTGKYEIMFLLSVRHSSYQEIVEHIQLMEFPYAICIDEDNAFRCLNPTIPDDPKYHTMYVDAGGRIRLVGDPVKNEKILNMFLKIVHL